MRTGQKSQAFTLTEVLVVLALVFTMLLFAFGALGNLRRHYTRSLDVHRMKQIGATWLLYAQEHQQQLAWRVNPTSFKTLACYLGYIKDPKDWSNTTDAEVKGSIFRNGADERAIRSLFVSAWDDRPAPDPLNSFTPNEYMGYNGREPSPEEGAEYVGYWNHIRQPETKIYVVPSWFLPGTYSVGRFSTSRNASPFRSDLNPADKGDFPALFADGHVEKVDPAPGLTAQQIKDRHILPRRSAP